MLVWKSNSGLKGEKQLFWWTLDFPDFLHVEIHLRKRFVLLTCGAHSTEYTQCIRHVFLDLFFFGKRHRWRHHDVSMMSLLKSSRAPRAPADRSRAGGAFARSQQRMHVRVRARYKPCRGSGPKVTGASPATSRAVARGRATRLGRIGHAQAQGRCQAGSPWHEGGCGTAGLSGGWLDWAEAASIQ